jgi:hypothetical protein
LHGLSTIEDQDRDENKETNKGGKDGDQEEVAGDLPNNAAAGILNLSARQSVVAVDRYARRRGEAQDWLLFYKTRKKNIKIN